MTIPEKKQKHPIQIIVDEGTIEVTKDIAIIDNTIIILEDTDTDTLKKQYPNALCADQVK